MNIKFSLIENNLFTLLQYPKQQTDNRLSALGSVSFMPPFKALGKMSAKRRAHRPIYLKWLYFRICSYLKMSVVTPDAALKLKQFPRFKGKSVTLSLQVRNISQNICELPRNTILFIPLNKFVKGIIYNCLLLHTAVVLRTPCNKPQSSRNPKTYTAFSADPEQTEQLQMSALYVCLSRTEIIYASLPQAAGYPHLIPVPQTAIMGNPNWCIYLLCQSSRKPPASCCIYSILQVTQPLALPIGNGALSREPPASLDTLT